MFSLLTPLLALASVALSASPYPYFQLKPRPKSSHRSLQQRCGTAHPEQHLRKSLRALNTMEPLEDNDLWSAETFYRQILSQPLHKRTDPLITIPLYIHIVSTVADSQPSSRMYASDTQITNQYNYLQSAFAQLSVSFTLISTDRTINDRWASGRDEYAMKQSLRLGPFSAMNLYIQSNFSAYDQNNNPLPDPVLGVCTLPLPNITTTSSPSEYVIDGCQILSGTLPGGASSPYNLGGTAVHEIGHWFGLLHTFEDETCAADSWGDYVADTPQQNRPTTGCPVRNSQDTCDTGKPAGWDGGPGQGPNPYNQQGYSGPDNTRNYMDYSTDVCYESFTAGQGARVVNAFNSLRKGK